jgi:hypothetical protein
MYLLVDISAIKSVVSGEATAARSTVVKRVTGDGSTSMVT